MFLRTLLIGFLALTTAPALQAERLRIFGDEAADADGSKDRVEVGLVVGWPVGVGLAVGYWGAPDKLPLVARLTTGLGTTIELGWGFKNERNIRAYAGVGAGAIGYLNLMAQVEYYVGPMVGLRIGDLSVGLGPAMRIRSGRPAQISILGNLGVSGLF